jgi:pimeloyl-ACP methyl ester carboxylesterase
VSSAEDSGPLIVKSCGAGPLPPDSLVVLAHGLWLSRHALFGWRRQFARRGIKAVTFGYPSREPLSDNTRRFAAFVQSLAASNIFILAHSLGGLLTLQLLAQFDAGDGKALSIRRAVLAGTPVAGSEAARRLARWRGGRWLIAGAGQVLGPSASEQRNRQIAALPVEIGVIAGTRELGLGRLFGPLARPNDGTVTVAETAFAGARDSITLPLSHSEMLLSGQVVAQAHAFFVNGGFDRGDKYAE